MSEYSPIYAKINAGVTLKIVITAKKILLLVSKPTEHKVPGTATICRFHLSIKITIYMSFLF